MKIAHLVDDEKFIDHCITIFDRNCNIENAFYLIAKYDNYKPLLVHNINRLIVKRERYFFSEEFYNSLKEFDCLILHCMDLKKIKICPLVPANLKIIWSGWGADYYTWITTEDEQLFHPETIKLINSWHYRKSFGLKGLLAPAKKIIKPLRRVLYSNNLLNNALQRIDYFSSPIPEDYDLLLFLLGAKFRAEYIQLNYGSLKMIMPNEGAPSVGDHILVGNSATPTNNHLDLFKLIRAHGLNGRKIFVPLSYGDINYAAYVKRMGEKWFGSDFKPILDFLPLEEYDLIISQCSTAIMGHRRQQGVGNIIALLFRGARVYLDQANPLYWFLRDRGACVSTIQELSSKKLFECHPITFEQVQLNRKILKDFWGDETVFGNVQKMVDKLQADRFS